MSELDQMKMTSREPSGEDRMTVRWITELESPRGLGCCGEVAHLETPAWGQMRYFDVTAREPGNTGRPTAVDACDRNKLSKGDAMPAVTVDPLTVPSIPVP